MRLHQLFSMLLVDWQIEDFIAKGKIQIEPFFKENIQPNSLDIRLGNHFVWNNGTNELIDTADEKTFRKTTKEIHSNCFDIRPGQFVLAETLEKITLSPSVVASIEGKSSIARLGISLHQTGGWIDAGFSGTITLELYNANCRTVRLYSGMSIGQLVFESTYDCAIPYNQRKSAKYMNQSGATISKYKIA